MSYVDAVSNAIAARGNALSQGALQSGQVWGNLAANLGQIPFQAMQAGQRRRLAEVETEQRGLQNQAMQKELDFQKEAYATMSRKDLTPEQLDLEMGNLLKRFGKFQEFEALQSRRVQTAVNKYNILKGGPGAPPEAGFALPEPTKGVTTPDVGLGTGGVRNAFAPVVPAEQQMVNPEVNIPGIGSFRPQTHGQQQLEQQQEAKAAAEIMLKRQKELQASGIEGQKDVARLTASLRPPPRDYLTSQRTRDPRSSTGWRWMQWDQEANAYSVPGNEAPVPPEIMAGMGVPTVLGTQAGQGGQPGQAVVFNPIKGGGGKVTTTPLPAGGPILSKTESEKEGMNANNAKSGLRAVATVRAMLADPTILAQASIPGSPGARKFDAARKEMVDVLTRLRTGAALNEDEEAFYTGQAPVLLDLTDPEAIEYKLKMFEDIYTPVANRRGTAAPPAPAGGGWTAADQKRLDDLERMDAEKKKKLAGTKK